ncbi:hypothetical protein ACHQM5_023603 [Ranunculus cassubicifolius]
MKELNPNAKPFDLPHYQQQQQQQYFNYQPFDYLNGYYGLVQVDYSRYIMEEQRKYQLLLRLQGNCPLGSSCLSCLSVAEYNTLFNYDDCSWPIELQTMAESGLRKLQLQSYPYFGCECCYTSSYDYFSNTSPYIISRPTLGADDDPLYRRRNFASCIGCEDVPSLVRKPLMPLGIYNPTDYSIPLFIRRRDVAIPNVIGSRNGLYYRSKDHRHEIGIAQQKERNLDLSDQFCCTGTCVMNCRPERNAGSVRRPSRRSLAKKLYQNDCLILQHRLHQGSPQEKDMIFEVLIKHMVELMMDPHGTYVAQKMLRYGNAEQRMKILHAVTKGPGELVRISRDVHGTRAVQELINYLTTSEEKSAFISALQPALLDLMQDLHGHHVVLHCLQLLPNEDNKFIFDGAVKFCFELATNPYGCYVLGSCITYATEQVRKVLLSKISSRADILAPEPLGNYIIRFILELEIGSVNATVMSQLEGKYVMLSKRKFSSRVIEKCLKVFGEEGREKIVNELISYPQFAMLLTDKYAHYVIQTTLQVTKGHLKEKLLEAIWPYIDTITHNRRICSLMQS